MYDLLLRGGVVVDGTGQPAYPGDVGIRDDTIVAIEPRIAERARRTLDLAGLVVAPGFIDIHTHYDAQVVWDPQLGSSARHGITTVLAGNCGFTVAPIQPGDSDYVIQMLSRVEGMPTAALREGLPWSWTSFGEYLAHVHDRLGVNFIAQVGHSALRRYVMGDAAWERAATADELEHIVQQLQTALTAGAWGFSTSTSPTHNDSAGRPVPSRLAAREEFLALAAALRGRPHRIIGISPGSKFVGISPDERSMMVDMAGAGHALVHWNPLVYSSAYPDLHVRSLEVSAATREVGERTIAVFNPGPPGPTKVDLRTGFLFESLPHWKSVLQLPVPARCAALADLAVRADLKADFEDDSAMGHLTAKFRTMWKTLTVAAAFTTQNDGYVGRTVGDIADETGRAPLDVMLDIAIPDELNTVFMQSDSASTDPAATDALMLLAQHDDVVFGGSDAGAHLDFMSNESLPSRALALRAREQGLLSVEAIVHGFTGRLADVYGIARRGHLEPGMAADVTVFDPDSIGASFPTLVRDLPGDSERFVTDPRGVTYTIVNGTVVCEDGAMTGALPGHVL
jgi:N-acyl-D-aspartate/D-glutamate deacylase